MRFSNANRFIETVTYLEKNSETRIGISAEAGAGWSPTRHLNIQGGIFTERELYIDRMALDEAGSLTEEKLKLFTTGSYIRFDWTENNMVYFILKGQGEKIFSNDPSETGWNIIISGGVEYSF